MTPELTDADRDAISAIVDREGRPESTYNAIALHFKAIGRAEAIAEAARLRNALEAVIEGSDHTRVFLTSRHKMHQTGVELWDLAHVIARRALG